MVSLARGGLPLTKRTRVVFSGADWFHCFGTRRSRAKPGDGHRIRCCSKGFRDRGGRVGPGADVAAGPPTASVTGVGLGVPQPGGSRLPRPTSGLLT